MSPKTKKKSRLQPPTTPKPRPNLPSQLLNLIKRKPNLWQNIHFVGCVTKTWRSPSRKCSPNGKSQLPQLVEIINEKEKNSGPHTLEIRFFENDPYPYRMRRTYYGKHWNLGKYCKGHSHGQIVEIVLTGTCSPAFALYRYDKWEGEGEWILENCTVKEPYAPAGINMRFCNGIGFQRKIYALSLQGTVVVIEQVDSSYRIDRIGGNRAVPRKVSRQFREYLVESEGEILLVFLVSRKSIRFADDVEVFKLDISTLLWEELRSIGDRALFLEDDCCLGVIASEVGCMKNCVYFNHSRSDEWCVFDLENGKIAPGFGSDADVKECGNWDEPVELE